MTSISANQGAVEPIALTDEQRQAVARFFDEHPDGGYKRALAAAGLITSGLETRHRKSGEGITAAQAKATIAGDDELAEYRLRALGLDEGSLFKTVGEIAKDPTHKDRLRAATWGLNAIHRHHENQAVEHSGPGGGPIVTEDRSASLADVAAILKTAGALPDDSG